MKYITKEELNQKLWLHKLWLRRSKKGERLDLSNYCLKHVNLSHQDLMYADLSYADLSYANLYNADLESANLEGVKYNAYTPFMFLQCPEEGSFIGFKKITVYDRLEEFDTEHFIVKLLITEDAKRTSKTTRVCYANKVKVLSITSIDGEETIESCEDGGVTPYTVGDVIEKEDISFFITKEEAKLY